jgi:hypothetical protein
MGPEPWLGALLCWPRMNDSLDVEVLYKSG